MAETLEIKSLEEKILQQAGIEVEDMSYLKSKLGDSKAYTEALKKLLANANLKNIGGVEKQTKDSFNQLVKGLSSVMDGVGSDITGYKAFNEAEQKVMNDAESRLTTAEAALKEVESMTDGFWNNVFKNRKSRLAAAKLELANAKIAVPEAEQEAKNMRESRQGNASFKESIQTMIEYGEAITRVFEKVIEKSEEKIESLTELRIDVQEKFETSEKQLKSLRQDIEIKEKELVNSREAMTDMHADEKAVQGGVCADIEIEIEKLRAQEREQIEIRDASEEFATISLGQLKSFQMTVAVAKSLKVSIEQKIEARKKSYAAAEQQLKMTKILNAGSDLSKAGNKTDKIIYELSAEIMEMTRKDFKERRDAHPQEMIQYTAILEQISNIANQFKDDISDYLKQIDEGFSSEKKVIKKKKDANSNGQLS